MPDRIMLKGRAAGAAWAAMESPPGEIMWMPGGTHTVTVSKGGKAHEVTVQVDRSTAAVLQQELARKVKETGQRPYFDLNHDDQAASAWPQEFLWKESPAPGVYARVEWSAAGAGAVVGKEYRSFSPAFFVESGDKGKPARISGAPMNMGGLVNDPAFREMAPLWAKGTKEGEGTAEYTEKVKGRKSANNAGPGAPGGASPGAGGDGKRKHESTRSKETMNKKEELLQAKQALEQEIEGLKGQDQSDAAVAEQLAAKKAELEKVGAQLEAVEAREKQAELEEALLAQRKKDAQAAVQAAVKRGAIPAKDLALQGKWEKRCTEDPENMELLNAMKGSPALDSTQKIIRINGVSIVKEDINAVLRAYAAEKDPMKKGLIYARELSERIRKREPIPLQASNTLGTVAGEIITQNALELLTLEFPLLRSIWTDFSPQQVPYNIELNTRIVSIPGTTVYSTSTGYATENTTTTDVPVTINSHYSCQVSFNANELGSTSRRLFDEQAPAMMYALGKLYVDAAYAVITAANYTNTATTEALIDFDRSTVIDIAAALTARGVPTAGRSLLLNGDYFAKLFSDTALVTLAAMQQGEIIREGRLPRVHGFDVYECVNLPTTNNLAGFGCSRSALVLATRVPVDYTQALPGVSGGGTLQTITEPNSGLSVALAQFIDHQLGAAYARVATMYGVAKGQINAGQRLTSA